MPKIKIYLDSQDLLNMYKAAPGSPYYDFQGFISNLVDRGCVEIPMSAPILSEVLQPAREEYFEDRLTRARLLNELSKGACLPYIGDLWNGLNLDGKRGWMPVDSLSEFNFTRFIDGMRDEIRKNENLSRADRRRLSSPKVFREEVLRNPRLLSGFDDPGKEVPFLREFIDGNYWRKFLKGEISIKEADEALQRWFVDYEAVFRLFHKYEGERGVIQEMFRSSEKKLFDSISLFQSSLLQARQAENELKVLKSDLRKSLKSMGFDWRFVREISADLKSNYISSYPTSDKVIGKNRNEFERVGVYEIVSAYIGASINGRSALNSDLRDILHSFYLSSVDLWRGDRSFSNVLISKKVPGWEKIRPSINDLYEDLLERFG